KALRMADGREELRRGCADALGGGVGGDELGKAPFELDELADEGVVLGVRDLGRVEHVAPGVGLGDLRPEREGALLGPAELDVVLHGHCPFTMPHSWPGPGLPSFVGAINAFAWYAREASRRRPCTTTVIATVIIVTTTIGTMAI